MIMLVFLTPQANAQKLSDEVVLTRGQAAVIISRAINDEKELETFELRAQDVPETHRYYREIKELAQLKIIDNNDNFAPDAPLQRAHAAKLIANAFHIEIDQQASSKFKDIPKNYWAKETIETLAKLGIMQGKSATTFAPTASLTETEMKKMMGNVLAFEKKRQNYEIAYDYLAKSYINTVSKQKALVADTLKLVNIERKKQGLPPLKSDPALGQLAVIKAQDLVSRGYFDHDSPHFGAPWDMATLFDYEYSSFGENIARNFSTAQSVTDAWMASPTHRSNILKGSYTNCGIAIEPDQKGHYYWVQLFSSK